MPVDPGQLRLLALIEELGSLTAAAHVLRLTPAAVTQQVARAERAWQVPLVARGPRGATLTEAGALLATHGRTVEEATERAAADMAALLGQLSLRLRVGAFQAAALHLLPRALIALRYRHPDADVSVVDLMSERGLGEITAGRLDLAVVASWDTPAPAPQVRTHRLLRDPMGGVLPDDHRLATGSPPGSPLRPEQLRDESWVAIMAGHAAREQLDRAADEAGFSPRVRFETESYDVAQALVGAGSGVALVSRLALTGIPGTTHRQLAPAEARTPPGYVVNGAKTWITNSRRSQLIALLCKTDPQASPRIRGSPSCWSSTDQGSPSPAITRPLRGPHPGRLRLLHRVRRGALLPRRATDDRRRGHQRDPAGVERIHGVVGDSLNPVVDAVRRTDGIEWVHV